MTVQYSVEFGSLRRLKATDGLKRSCGGRTRSPARRGACVICPVVTRVWLCRRCKRAVGDAPNGHPTKGQVGRVGTSLTGCGSRLGLGNATPGARSPFGWQRGQRQHAVEALLLGTTTQPKTQAVVAMNSVSSCRATQLPACPRARPARGVAGPTLPVVLPMPVHARSHVSGADAGRAGATPEPTHFRISNRRHMVPWYKRATTVKHSAGTN